MKKNVTNLCFVFIISSVFLFFSCVRHADEPVKAEAAADKVSGGNDSRLEDAGNAGAEADSGLFAAISEPSGRDFLLYYDPEAERIYPEDFSIGELQPLEDIDADMESVADAADGFLSAIVNGKIDDEFIASSKRDFIRRNIEDQMDILPEDYRLGVINMGTDPASARVRFIGETGYSEGVIYFMREAGWKIYDFHMDFSRMNEPSGKVDGGYLWGTVSAE